VGAWWRALRAVAARHGDGGRFATGEKGRCATWGWWSLRDGGEGSLRDMGMVVASRRGRRVAARHGDGGRFATGEKGRCATWGWWSLRDGGEGSLRDMGMVVAARRGRRVAARRSVGAKVPRESLGLFAFVVQTLVRTGRGRWRFLESATRPGPKTFGGGKPQLSAFPRTPSRNVAERRPRLRRNASRFSGRQPS
jgi:hypothetical protein